MPKHATEDRARTFWNLTGTPKKFFVRPGGDDNNAGDTAATAFKTIPRALFEMEKDFWNGSYIVDITGCIVNENIVFPQVRSGGHVYGPNADATGNRNNPTQDEYGAAFRSAVNFRATPTVIFTGPRQTMSSTYNDPNGIDVWRTITVTGVNWAPDIYKGKFFVSSYGNLVPIYGNDATRLFFQESHVDVDTNPVDNTQYTTITIVEPGATFVANKYGQYILDSLLGGYTFFGIKFEMHDDGVTSMDEWMKITHCPSLVFEACSFDYVGNNPFARIRVGGNGLVRWIRTYNRACDLRSVGGAQMFFDNVWEKNIGSGHMPNYVDQTTPLATVITMSGGRYSSFSIDSSQYQPQVYIENVTFYDYVDLTSARGSLSGCRLAYSNQGRGSFLDMSYTFIRDFLNVLPGGWCHLTLGGGPKPAQVQVGELAPVLAANINIPFRQNDPNTGATLMIDG